ncbi:hypothetical protein CYLTODRAFT_445090 [Cylindrobasidium torrendii FP15055 ss-10]|uniref:BZIP domain-containing protein n=1 Tax=Cylindrobasidium torrendii FP15055 ss-10 TaxID=1314674 RepID=A0A0D7B6K9_9AGAR|nr:hypothetical protein CYLTODRAFT_445090 [Cylindrobasidium torrendii FP15055 ss-10]
MTRGRKKDMTIPPSRALTQQRDYRARRAQYVTELEQRCSKLEVENSELRQEIHGLRLKLPATSVHNPQVVATSRQLMEELSTVTSTLSRFQHLVFAEANTFPPPKALPTGNPSSEPIVGRHSSYNQYSPSLHTGAIPSPLSLGSPSSSSLSPSPEIRACHAPPSFPRDILHSEAPGASTSRVNAPSFLFDKDGTEGASDGPWPPPPPPPSF